MATNKRKIIIWSSVGVLAGTILYLVINKARKNALRNAVISAIGDPSAGLGTYEDLEASKAFDVNYWKNAPSGTKLLTNAQQNNAAKIIKDAPSSTLVGNDDEESVVALFKTFTNQYQVSQVSNAFYRNYSQDLYKFMEEFMPNKYNPLYDNYMKQVLEIVKRLK